ncbi:ribosome biogenesis GTPase A [Plasmodium gonderi]|uniref:Ribosome biogenesis GTPase A n=1 Tax=Plasmodium gonderi TaxID=77519 RepID=A0A1Y1JGT8_PLAGO|nr:ribosome biogenesis GTPase A [Plasmodium gonderi]GAW79284.1 ribosome biogenesis GTPase A [Plasmodium gonderi]
MFLKFVLVWISITKNLLCINLTEWNSIKNIEIAQVGKFISFERHEKRRKRRMVTTKDCLFLYNPRNNPIFCYYKNRIRNKNETNVENNNSPMTFDEFFNKRAEEDYRKLEAEKLKIMKENVSTYKEEIRKVLEKSYKNEYERLLREEKEDAEVSQEVHENMKITFLMKENINNILFTRYSYMINKLKERSAILKGVRGLFETSKTKPGDAALNVTPTDEEHHNMAGPLDETSTSTSPSVEPLRLDPSDDKQEDSTQIIENVQFFKPQASYGGGTCREARNCTTFSDQIFANAKLLVKVKEENENGWKSDVQGNKLGSEEEDTNVITGLGIEKDEEEEEEGGKVLFSKSNVSALKLFKENVNTFLSYKKENIIKSNLNEDLLYGRVKVHWFPKFMKKVISKIPEYIKISDIIIEVRNGIIPYVFDDLYALNMFDIRTNKPKIIVYTNCDRSSIRGNEEWGSYYRRKLFWYDKNFNKNVVNRDSASDACVGTASASNAYVSTASANDASVKNQLKKSAVIFVDAKNGKKEIIVLKKLINRLSQHIIESKKKKGLLNYKVKCIFIGLPNVGKSALINRLLEIKKTKSYDYPGLTTNIQMYASKKYELIDTPGILAQNLYTLPEKKYCKKNIILDKIYNYDSNSNASDDKVVHIRNYNSYMHIENNIYLLALCNHISPKMYDIYNVAEALIQNMHSVYLYNNDYIDMSKIIKRYQINFTECLDFEGKFSAYHFIQRLARDRFHNDLNQASMRLVTDFRKGYLGRMTLSYPLYFNKRSIRLRVSSGFVNQPNDCYIGW